MKWEEWLVKKAEREAKMREKHYELVCASDPGKQFKMLTTAKRHAEIESGFYPHRTYKVREIATGKVLWEVHNGVIRRPKGFRKPKKTPKPELILTQSAKVSHEIHEQAQQAT